MSEIATRNLILCSDGTGQRGGKTRTNVWRIYQAVDRTSADPEQLAFYDDGVGTEDFKLLKILGKATGMGLSENIRGLYRWLMLNYQPGDRIFLFGFSRGAYTVRTLAGMLKHCGLALGHELDASQAGPITKEVYSNYYRGSLWRRLLAWLPMRPPSRRALPSSFRPTSVELPQPLKVVHPDIWFLGVWDTVGAVGLPPWLRAGRWSPLTLIFKFHDINANNWWNACHAVAVDDERKSFWPEALPEPGEVPEGPTDGERTEPLPETFDRKVIVEQVLFAGAHSNVGGGYPKDGLAFMALDWMSTNARNRGLAISGEARAEGRHRRNAHDRIYDPRSGLAAFYRYAPRDFARIERDYRKRYKEDKRTPLPLSTVHTAVFDRIRRSTAGYAPPNLPDGLGIAATGKGKGGALDDRESRRVERHEGRLAMVDKGGARRAKLAETQAPVWIRKTLYWALILFTIALVADVIYLLNNPVEAEAVKMTPFKQIAWFGSLFVPSFAETLSRQLLQQAVDYWLIAVPLVVAFCAALALRQHQKAKGEKISLQAWHDFRSARSAGRPAGE